MTEQTLERLAYIAAHRVLSLESLDSQAIPAKQYACAGKRRSVTVERIAEAIKGVFQGAEQAELSSMFADVRRSEVER